MTLRPYTTPGAPDVPLLLKEDVERFASELIASLRRTDEPAAALLVALRCTQEGLDVKEIDV